MWQRMSFVYARNHNNCRNDKITEWRTYAGRDNQIK